MRYASLRQGLVGAWCPSVSGPFGYRLPDLSGYGNHGVLTNMEDVDWTASGGNSALDFDGSTDYVTLPFKFTGNYATFAMWINYRTSAQYKAFLFGRVGTTSPAIGMQSTSSNNKVGYTWNNNSSATYNWTGGPTIPTNEWVFIAVTIDPGKAVAYLANKTRPLTSGTNAISHISQTVNENWRIAYDDIGAGGRYTNMQADDIRIYNRALSAQEIRLLASERGIGLKPERQRNRYSLPVTTSSRNRSSRFLGFPA